MSTPNGAITPFAAGTDLVNYRDWRQLADWISANDARGTLAALAGVTDQQTLSCNYSPTGGTFALTFTPDVGSPIVLAGIPYNVTAAQLAAALGIPVGSLPAISGAIVCTGGPLPGTPIVVNLAGGALIGPQNLMTVDGSNLSGGTPGSISVAHTTPGLLPAPAVLAHLLANSGRIEAAAFAGARYSGQDLAALTGNSLQLLTSLCCWLTVGTLSRMKTRLNYIAPEIEAAEFTLKRLGNGETVFSLAEQQQAGLASLAPAYDDDRPSRRASRFFGLRDRRD